MNEPLPALQGAGALARRFEELLKGSGSDEQFLRDVARLAAGSAESPWEALAAIDQLYRRGKLSSRLFRAARIGIERRVLGVSDEARAVPPKPLRSIPVWPVHAADSHPSSPLAPSAADIANRADMELQQLRIELERARREAAAYLQRLEQLSWPALSPSETSVSPAVVTPLVAATEEPPAAAPPSASPPASAPLHVVPESSLSLAVAAPEPEPEPRRAVIVPAAPRRAAIESLTRATARPLRRPHSAAMRLRAGVAWLSTRMARLRGRRSLWLLRLVALAVGLLLLAQLPVRRAPMAVPSVAGIAPAPPAPESLPAQDTRAATPAPGVVSLVTDRYVLQPGERAALVALRRSEGSDGEVTVQWRVSAASAQHGRDYGGATRGRLVLAPGVTQAQIEIPVLRNPERRHTEFFDVRLVTVEGGAQLGELTRATVFLMPVARTDARRPQ